ncbi:beta-galactosidase [bacterium]|nr:beta-galactosidase [bacterium]
MLFKAPLTGLGLLLVLIACSFSLLSAQDEWGQLQEFEDGDLSRWSVTGGALALDSVYATERKHDLRVEFQAGGVLSVELGGLWRMEQIIREKAGDEGGGGWKIQEAIFVDLYSPVPLSLRLTFRDSLGGSWSTLRTLSQGLNHVQYRREQLAGVDWLALRRVEFSPAAAATLYLDHLRTWEHQPELDSRGRMDIVYSDSVRTPHVAWQRPDAAGPLRGLFVPRAGSGRVMVELMQRFELEPTTVTFEPSLGLHRWAFGDFYGTRALEYDHVTDKFSVSYTALTSELESPRRFEVIALPNLRSWADTPPELRKVLLKRVAEGCGLVLFQPVAGGPAPDLEELSPLAGQTRLELYSPRAADQPEERPAGLAPGGGAWKADDPAHYITRGIPLELIPAADIHHVRYTAKPGARVLISAADGSPILAVGSYGKGRVAVFAWEDQGMFPRVDRPLEDKNGLPYWEYLYALTGRTLRWAAGRDGAGGFGGVVLGKVTGEGPLGITGALTCAPGDSLRVEIRDQEYRVLAERRLPASSGPLELAFPDLPFCTRMVANLWLTRRGRVVDFASAGCSFFGWNRIASLATGLDTYELGDTVSGTVRLDPHGQPARVALELSDNRGRTLAVDTLSLGAGQPGTFSLPTALCLARRAVVTARVLDGNGRAVHSSRAELFIDRPTPWDDYEVMMYRFMPQITAGEWPFLDRYMERLGVTAWAAVPPEFAFRSNLELQAETRLDTEESQDGAGEVPYREQKKNYVATHDKKYLIRRYCLHDPSYLKEQKEIVQRQVKQFKRFSPLSYYCYEEPSLTHYGDAFDLCFGPHTLAAFRDWLKGQYGSLAALNAQWGAAFTSWDAVTPDDTPGAQARGNFSSWSDHRIFMEKSYADNYAYVRRMVREIDPEGRVMMTGTQRTVAQNGYDYYLLDQTIDHTQPYGEPERHKAFMRAGGKITGCTGYGVSGVKLDYELWGRLFAGHTAGSAIFWQFSTLDPDYRLCKSGADMLRIFGELRHGGVARLLTTAHWTPSEVVLFWSMPALHGSWIQDGRIVEQDGAPSAAFERWEFNYESWRWLLDDLGVPYRAMSWQMLEQGWLEKSGARVLVLPATIALSEKGTAAVRNFVQAGGAVIADAQPAVMDGHCKWLEKGGLDGLFGLSGQRARLIPTVGDYTEVRGAVHGLAVADSGVQPAGASRADYGPGLPGVLRGSVGQGRTFFLNAWLAGYGRLRQTGGGAEVRQGLAALLKDAGYKPLIELRPSAGGDLQAVRLTSYNLGQGYVLGLLKDYRSADPRQDLDLTLPAAGYQYDVRAGRYLGFGSVLRTDIAPGEVRLVASLPYRVSGLELKGPQTASRGQAVEFGATVLAAEGKEAGPHVLVARVFDPSGAAVDYYGKNLSAQNGQASFSLPLALSDTPGRWRVRVRDVVSGVSGQWAFQVQ